MINGRRRLREWKASNDNKDVSCSCCIPLNISLHQILFLTLTLYLKFHIKSNFFSYKYYYYLQPISCLFLYIFPLLYILFSYKLKIWLQNIINFSFTQKNNNIISIWYISYSILLFQFLTFLVLKYLKIFKSLTITIYEKSHQY